jgi:hypothetical protein
MLFRLVILAGCDRDERRLVGFWPTKRGAVPSAPGVGLDTAPQNGCCTATFGCWIGTIKKSASYKNSAAAERRSGTLG